jgi:hypothetical protein
MKLLKNETIIVDTEICKITNSRVITGKTSSNQIFKEKKSVEFDDINSFELIMNMGEESKIITGFKYLAAGLAVMAIISIVPFLSNQTIQSFFFLIGVIPLIYGGYLIPKSIFRLKEHSTIFLWLQNGKCIIVSFPNFDDINANKIQSHLSEIGIRLASK